MIEYYTPSLQPYYGGNLPSNWEDFIFGEGNIIYGHFIGSLFGLSATSRFAANNQREVLITQHDQLSYEYSVITLNYDLILENVISFIKKQYTVIDKICFNKAGGASGKGINLTKLHGCVVFKENKVLD